MASEPIDRVKRTARCVVNHRGHREHRARTGKEWARIRKLSAPATRPPRPRCARPRLPISVSSVSSVVKIPDMDGRSRITNADLGSGFNTEDTKDTETGKLRVFRILASGQFSLSCPPCENPGTNCGESEKPVRCFGHDLVRRFRVRNCTMGVPRCRRSPARASNCIWDGCGRGSGLDCAGRPGRRGERGVWDCRQSRGDPCFGQRPSQRGLARDTESGIRAAVAPVRWRRGLGGKPPSERS